PPAWVHDVPVRQSGSTAEPRGTTRRRRVARGGRALSAAPGRRPTLPQQTSRPATARPPAPCPHRPPAPSAEPCLAPAPRTLRKRRRTAPASFPFPRPAAARRRRTTPTTRRPRPREPGDKTMMKPQLANPGDAGLPEIFLTDEEHARLSLLVGDGEARGVAGLLQQELDRATLCDAAERPAHAVGLDRWLH